MTTKMKLSKQTRGQGALDSFPRLLGERLCFNFVNTLEKMHAAGPVEFLPSFADLARWGHHVGVLSETDVREALRWASDCQVEADHLFERAQTLRNSLTHIFTTIAHGGVPGEEDFVGLEFEYVQAAPSLHLRPAGTQYAWQWNQPTRPVDRLLWEISESAIHVLSSDDLGRIKECPGANDCGSLFYDTSRNGTRLWCSMEGCGSRVKMRRQYARSTGRG